MASIICLHDVGFVACCHSQLSKLPDQACLSLLSSLKAQSRDFPVSQACNDK